MPACRPRSSTLSESGDGKTCWQSNHPQVLGRFHNHQNSAKQVRIWRSLCRRAKRLISRRALVFNAAPIRGRHADGAGMQMHATTSFTQNLMNDLTSIKHDQLTSMNSLKMRNAWGFRVRDGCQASGFEGLGLWGSGLQGWCCSNDR